MDKHMGVGKFVLPDKYRLAVLYKEQVKALCQLNRAAESRPTLKKLKALTDQRKWTQWMYYEAAFYESLFSNNYAAAEKLNRQLTEYCLSTANFTRLRNLGLAHGQLLQEKGRSDAAIEGYLSVIDSIDSLYKRAGTEAIFSEKFNQLHLPFYERVIELMVEASKSPQQILAITEKTKSRHLSQILLARNNAANLIHPDDREEFLKLQGLYRDQMILAASLTDPEERKLSRESAVFIKEQMDELEVLSGEKGAERRGLLSLSSGADFQPGRDFISYWLGTKFSLRFVNQGGRLSMQKLPPRAVIAAQVEKYRALLRDPQSDPLNSAPAKILAQLLLPENLSPSMLILPDAELNLLPFETLPYANRYLLEESKLTYAPSLAVAAAIKADKSKVVGKMLIVANPDFGSISSGEMRGYFKDRGQALPALPGTQIEAEAISKVYPASSLMTGEKANEDDFRQINPAGFGILHFATHGLLEDELDGLHEPALALSQRGDNDGFLTASEINGLTLDARLVTLSACNTASGRISSGDGVVSLAASFLNAGSRNVVVSTWSVSDQATAVLMAEFYARLKEGDSVSAALRRAKIELKKNSTSLRGHLRGVGGVQQSDKVDYSHPYYWAPFIHVGP